MLVMDVIFCPFRKKKGGEEMLTDIKQDREEEINQKRNEILDTLGRIKDVLEKTNRNLCWWDGHKCCFTSIKGLSEADDWCKGCHQIDWKKFTDLVAEIFSVSFYSEEELEEEVAEAKKSAKEEGRREGRGEAYDEILGSLNDFIESSIKK